MPDFDIVTYTISMPNYVVGGIRRSLEQPQYSSSSSSGYSPRAGSKALQQQARVLEWVNCISTLVLNVIHLIYIFLR